MEIVKVIYRIRYPKMLNFKDIYKDIINPYFIYPNAKFSISNEGTHVESIRMTFPESFYHLAFTYETIGFYFDGSTEELKVNGSHINICFDICNKLRQVNTFNEVSSEFIEIIAVKELDKTEQEIQSKFITDHKFMHIFKNMSDSGIVLEGNDKDITGRIQYGPYNAKVDIEGWSLFSLDQKKNVEYLDKDGIIVSCRLQKKADKISNGTFLSLCKKAEDYIEKIISKYE